MFFKRTYEGVGTTEIAKFVAAINNILKAFNTINFIVPFDYRGVTPVANLNKVGQLEIDMQDMVVFNPSRVVSRLTGPGKATASVENGFLTINIVYVPEE